MFLISGSQTADKKLGFVADFCHTCHAIKPFQLNRIGEGEHLYFIPLGCSQVTGHIGQCQDCRIQVSLNALCYSDIAKSPGHDLESLIQGTFPTVREFHAGRLALAKLLFEGKLPSAEREVMLTELWQNYALHTEATTGKGIQFGGRGGWGLMFTFLAAFILALSTIWSPPAWHGATFQAMGVVFVIGVIYSITQMILDPGRVSREILSSLALRLKPFDPSRDEIVAYLERLKRAGFKLGRKIKPDTLMLEISSAHAASPPLRMG